jgi:hypothetical protein
MFDARFSLRLNLLRWRVTRVRLSRSMLFLNRLEEELANFDHVWAEIDEQTVLHATCCHSILANLLKMTVP